MIILYQNCIFAEYFTIMLSKYLKCGVTTLILAVSAIAVADARDFVLVLDPGHGGKDYGAIGKITNEKTINLKVAKLVGEKIEEMFDDVEIVYTRDDDSFVSLKDRAAIANDSGGDLFISIHVNSVDKKNRNRSIIQGASVYTLGLHKSADNLEVAKRENAVMAMEDDYNSSYEGFNPDSSESYIIFELSQNQHLEQSVRLAGNIQDQLVKTANRVDKGVRQAGFWVLWSTGMPSVLIELDFICNPEQEKYLASEQGREELSDAIVNAFATYKSVRANLPLDVKVSDVRAVRRTPYSAPNPESEKKMNPVSPSDKETYQIQFLTSSKELSADSKELKGLIGSTFYKENGLYKYTTGNYATLEEAKKRLPEVQAKFSSAFIIKMKNGKRIK